MLTLKAKLSSCSIIIHTVECEERKICHRKRARAYELFVCYLFIVFCSFEEVDVDIARRDRALALIVEPSLLYLPERVLPEAPSRVRVPSSI